MPDIQLNRPARTWRRKPPALDLAALLPSWELALRAERKSPQTIKSYGDGVRGFIRWCHDNGRTPALDRDLVKGYIADLLDAGAEPATARARQLGVRRFSAGSKRRARSTTIRCSGSRPRNWTPRSPRA